MQSGIEQQRLFESQVGRLGEGHFLILYWSAQSEGKGIRYNITNLFDDLKHAGITRTKQTAVSSLSSLYSLCFIDIRDEHNRKNIYITKSGAKALETLILEERYQVRASSFLEAQK